MAENAPSGKTADGENDDSYPHQKVCSASNNDNGLPAPTFAPPTSEELSNKEEEMCVSVFDRVDLELAGMKARKGKLEKNKSAPQVPQAPVVSSTKTNPDNSTGMFIKRYVPVIIDNPASHLKLNSAKLQKVWEKTLEYLPLQVHQQVTSAKREERSVAIKVNVKDRSIKVVDIDEEKSKVNVKDRSIKVVDIDKEKSKVNVKDRSIKVVDIDKEKSKVNVKDASIKIIDIEEEVKSLISSKSIQAVPNEKETFALFLTTRLLFELVIEEKDEEFVCKNCKIWFSSKSDAARHVHAHSPFRCDACDLVFLTYLDMTDHYRIEHNQKYYCNHCLFVTDGKNVHRMHKTSVHRAERLPKCSEQLCFVCGETFRLHSQIIEHLLSEHGVDQEMVSSEGYLKCPVCNSLCASSSYLKDHIRIHRGNMYTCQVPGCGFTCSSKCKLNHHTLTHSIKRDFPCTYESCTSSFKRKHRLKEHIEQVHLQLRNFCCDVCNKTFVAQKHLTVHKRIHSDEKPIGCSHCEYRCRQKAALKWHMKNKHPDVAPEPGKTPPNDNQLQPGRKARGKKRVAKKDKTTRKTSKRQKLETLSDTESDSNSSSQLCDDDDHDYKPRNDTLTQDYEIDDFITSLIGVEEGHQ